MQIKTDLKLNYSDVLIEPKRSTLNSRKDVDLIREHKFCYSSKIYKGIPVVGSNMDSIGTFQMAKALSGYKLFTVLSKHYCFEDWKAWFKSNDEGRDSHIPLTARQHIAVSTGTNYIHDPEAQDYALLKKLMSTYKELHYICIDVANAYNENVARFVSQVRDDFPDHVIMVGNVCTPEMTEQLIISGADIIKVGIGGGCLAGDTRILMADGTYKNILEVKTGDRVINKDGKPVTVKRQFQTGYRKVREVTTNSFHKPLGITSEHKCFVGDLSSTSQTTISSRGFQKLLKQPTKSGDSKLKWKEISDTEKCTFLAPTKVEFELPENFTYDISEYFLKEEHKKNYNLQISSTYDTGYLFGFFLGNGTQNRGQVSWRFAQTKNYKKLKNAIKNVTGKNCGLTFPDDIMVSLNLYSKQWSELFSEFGKKENKHLPQKYMCLNKDYLQGLYDGLCDADGHLTSEGRRSFTNTSTSLIELMYFLSFQLGLGLPCASSSGLKTTNLVTATNECFTTRWLLKPKVRQVNDYFIVKQLNQSEEGKVFVPVYDLEIDDETHSFIANNIIVHNSVCTTRSMTGVGYPQLSAVIECADAAHGLNGKIIADGGCVCPGDVVKAFGGGADFVMLGGMLAGHDEGYSGDLGAGHSTVPFYGMSSDHAMSIHGARKDGYRGSEGRYIEISRRGPVKDTVEEILGGLRSACTYIGARRIKDIPKCTTFVKTSQQLNLSLQEFF